MGIILRTARAIMATLQPMTGTRAEGSALVTATGDDVSIPRNNYALPVIEGQQRPDLAMKVAEGPNSDGSWTVTSEGTVVEMFSNLGGRRMCIPSSTVLAFDPQISGIRSAEAVDLFQGGIDPAGFGALRDLVFYEHLSGDLARDMARSSLRGFPGSLLAWVDDEPVDGSSTDMTNRRNRMGTRKALYKVNYQLMVVSERAESDHVRRADGLEVLDWMAELLADRQNIDGQPFSNPSGLQIVRRWRETGGGPFYQRFYVYGMLVSAMVVLSRDDTRTWNQWLLTTVDVDKPDDSGDLDMVDMAMEMTQDDD
jgi:hypothetical protein